MTAAPLDLLTATFLVCLGSAIVPFLNTEIYLLGVSALAGPAALPAVVLAATAGQMAGKSILYFAGTGALRLPTRFRQMAPVLAARVAAHPSGASGLILFSAFSGLPPFYGVSLVAGGLGWSFARFVLAGCCGRALRFALVVTLPQLAKSAAW